MAYDIAIDNEQFNTWVLAFGSSVEDVASANGAINAPIESRSKAIDSYRETVEAFVSLVAEYKDLLEKDCEDIIAAVDSINKSDSEFADSFHEGRANSKLPNACKVD